VVAKNNKIYALEMNNIRKKDPQGSPSKVYSFQRNKSDKNLYKSFEKKENMKSKSDRNNFLKNIFL